MNIVQLFTLVCSAAHDFQNNKMMDAENIEVETWVANEV
jgi:hypothetical protein